MTPHSRTEVDKIVSWQVQCVDQQEDHTFLWPLSPSPFNFGHRCFGLYRYTLTKGTPSRSVAHSSWDTLYTDDRDFQYLSLSLGTLNLVCDLKTLCSFIASGPYAPEHCTHFAWIVLDSHAISHVNAVSEILINNFSTWDTHICVRATAWTQPILQCWSRSVLKWKREQTISQKNGILSKHRCGNRKSQMNAVYTVMFIVCVQDSPNNSFKSVAWCITSRTAPIYGEALLPYLISHYGECPSLLDARDSWFSITGIPCLDAVSLMRSLMAYHAMVTKDHC